MAVGNEGSAQLGSKGGGSIPQQGSNTVGNPDTPVWNAPGSGPVPIGSTTVDNPDTPADGGRSGPIPGGGRMKPNAS